MYFKVSAVVVHYQFVLHDFVHYAAV